MSVHVSSVVEVGWSLVRDLLRVPRYQNAKPDATVLLGPGTDMVKVNKMLGKTRQTALFFLRTMRTCFWNKKYCEVLSLRQMPLKAMVGSWELASVIGHGIPFLLLPLDSIQPFYKPEIGNFSASDSLRPCRLWSDHQSSNFPSFAQRMWCLSSHVKSTSAERFKCWSCADLRLLLYVTHIQTMRELWDLLREPVRRTELGDWDPEDLEEPRWAETTHVVVVNDMAITWQ